MVTVLLPPWIVTYILPVESIAIPSGEFVIVPNGPYTTDEPKAGICAITVPLPVDEAVISKVVPLFGVTWTILTTLKLGAVPVSTISLAVNVLTSIGWLNTAVNLTGLVVVGSI